MSKTSSLELAKQILLGSIEFAPFCIEHDTQGNAILAEEFSNQIAAIIRTDIRKMWTKRLTGTVTTFTMATTAIDHALEHIGEEKQAEFRNLQISAPQLNNWKSTTEIEIALDINLLYPYHWFPMKFIMEI